MIAISTRATGKSQELALTRDGMSHGWKAVSISDCDSSAKMMQLHRMRNTIRLFYIY